MADELVAIRHKRRLTRPELSQLTGLSVSTIQRLENAQTAMSMTQLRDICRALDVSPRWFVDAVLSEIGE